MAGEDLETLRSDTIQLIKDLSDAHEQSWEYRLNDVTAASDTVVAKRLELLEERVRKLATSEYPLLWEALLGLLFTAVPVARIVEGLTMHLARSFKLGRIVASPVFARGKGLVAPDPELRGTIWVPSSDVVWAREVIEYDAAIVSFAKTYNSEIAATTRAIVRSAIKPSQKQPIVSQDELFTTGKSSASAKSGDDDAGAPAFLKGVRDWISTTKIADLRVLDDLLESVRATDDVDTIKTISEYLAEDDAEEKPTVDRDAFQRFIEMCIWCTTWDFIPRFVPGGRGPTIATASYRPPRLELPPFGDAFWEFAVKRYFDPFFGEGDQTYNDIGVHPWPAPSTAYSVPLELEQYLEGGSMASTPPADDASSGRGSGFAQPSPPKGLYPAERLAFQWGFIIAPDLFNMNLTIGEGLASKLGVEPQ